MNTRRFERARRSPLPNTSCALVQVAAVLLLVILLTPVLVDCGSSPTSSPAVPAKSSASTESPKQAELLAKLYEAARKEGEVNVESGQTAEVIKPLFDAFTAKYPGIRINYTNRVGGETVERIIAESSANRIGVDVNSATFRTVLPLADRNLLMKADWKALVPDLPPAALLLGDRLVAWYHMPVVVAYNTNLIKQGDLPKDWEDLLDPKWRGRKMILDTRGGAFDFLPFVWGEQRAYDFTSKLKEQGAILVPRFSVSLERVSAGEAPIGTANLPTLLQYQKQGAPVSWVPLSWYGASTIGLYVTSGGPHPNAGQLLASFLLSSEGRKLYEDAAYSAFVFPGTDSRMERELRQGKVQVWFEDSEQKARDRAKYGDKIQELLGALR